MISYFSMHKISDEITTYGGDADRQLFILVPRVKWGEAKGELYLCLEGDSDIKNKIITMHIDYINWLMNNSQNLLNIPKSEWWNDSIEPYHRYDEFFNYLEKLKEAIRSEY